MQYIIMANGKGTRWNNYLGITKQEAKINDERIIDRIVRQIKERTNDKILISSANKNHENIYAVRILSKYNNHFHKMYTYEYLNDTTTFLYGDTYYSDEVMDIITSDCDNDIIFYGNENAIIALKIYNIDLFKYVLDNIDENNHSLYHSFDYVRHLRKFINVGNVFFNINDQNDYERLKIQEKKLILK